MPYVVIFVVAFLGFMFFGESKENDPEVVQANLDGQAIVLCDKSIKAQLQNPSSYDRHWTTQRIFSRSLGEGKGRKVLFQFEAKNGFGNLVTRKATCSIDDDGKVTNAQIFNG